MRLIDADALKAVIEEEAEGLETLAFQLATTACINHIEEAPTVNAVPKQHLVNWAYVTRCKDCFFYDPLDAKRPFTCERSNMTVTETDYCSFAERRTGHEVD